MTDVTGTTEKEWSLPRGAIVLLGGAGLVVTAAGMRAFADVLAPVVLALMLTVAVYPIGTWLQRKGAPGWLRTIVVMFSAFGILAMFVFIIGYAGVRLADLIPTYSDDFNELTKSVSDWLSSVGVDESQIDAAFDELQAVNARIGDELQFTDEGLAKRKPRWAAR